MLENFPDFLYKIFCTEELKKKKKKKDYEIRAQGQGLFEDLFSIKAKDGVKLIATLTFC